MRNRHAFSFSRRLRRTTGVALAACLVLRALIPGGYMPGNLLAGEFMVLCPEGLPPVDMMPGHAGHGDPDLPALDADRSCPIGTALLAAAPAPEAGQVATLVRGAATGVPPAVSPPRRHSPAGYRPRAPPPARIVS
ncbi:MAG: hypothetical protein U5K76_08910 [Woeseiaceae bacterium]|nr:hypothetical protein [Woeseiaceae bacterium]